MRYLCISILKQLILYLLLLCQATRTTCTLSWSTDQISNSDRDSIEWLHEKHLNRLKEREITFNNNHIVRPLITMAHMCWLNIFRTNVAKNDTLRHISGHIVTSGTGCTGVSFLPPITPTLVYLLILTIVLQPAEWDTNFPRRTTEIH